MQQTESDFDDLDVIPLELSGSVMPLREDGIRWSSPRRQIGLAAAVASVGLGLIVVGVPLGMLLGPQGVLVCGMIPGPTLILLSLVPLLATVPMELDDHNLLSKGWVYRTFLDGQRVRIHGRPGRNITVTVDAIDVLSTKVGERGKAWTYDALTWFVKRLARDLGTEVEDERDELAWRAYLAGSMDRAKARFDSDLEKNLVAFPEYHLYEASKPREHWEHDRVVMRFKSASRGRDSFSIDATSLRVKGTSYPLTDLQRVAVFYYRVRRKGPDYWVGNIVFMCGGFRRAMMAHRVDQNEGICGELVWMADRIREAAEQTRDHDAVDVVGSEQDIPDELRRLSQRPRAPEEG